MKVPQNIEYVTRLTHRMEVMREVIDKNLHENQARIELYFDKKAKKRIFALGEFVWRYTPTVIRGVLLQYHGPYVIHKQTDPNTYRLRLLSGRVLNHSNNVPYLTPFKHRVIKSVRPPNEVKAK